MTNVNESAVDKAIREAKEKAATAAPAIETQAVATTGGAIVHQALTPQVATLATLTNAGMNVDEWLKTNGHGLQIGSKAQLLKSIKVRLSLKDIVAFYGVRFGDPANYFKSFDRVTCTAGGTWPEAIAKAQRADVKCKGEYIGADITLHVVEDIKADDGTVLVEAGKRLGHSTSPTGGKTIAAFIREVQSRGIAEDTQMIVEVKHVQRTKPNVQPWGVLELVIVDVLEEDAE